MIGTTSCAPSSEIRAGCVRLNFSAMVDFAVVARADDEEVARAQPPRLVPEQAIHLSQPRGPGYGRSNDRHAGAPGAQLQEALRARGFRAADGSSSGPSLTSPRCRRTAVAV